MGFWPGAVGCAATTGSYYLDYIIPDLRLYGTGLKVRTQLCKLLHGVESPHAKCYRNSAADKLAFTTTLLALRA